MKYSLAFTLALCIPLFVFPGCLEEHVRTTISADGSSERSISLKLPAKELPEKAFPVPADSTWSVEWKETGDKDSTLKYEYTARKIFSTPEELRREYAALPDTGGMSIGVSVDKRFQWFFTYLDYTETYIYHNPFTNVPVTDYLTRSEIEQFQHGEQNDENKGADGHAGGPAADAGIRSGDIIRQVNRRPVSSAAELQQSVRDTGNRPALMLIERGGNTLFVAVATDRS